MGMSREKRLPDYTQPRHLCAASRASYPFMVPIPANMLSVRVLHRAPVSADAAALWLAQPGTQHAPTPYRPGQFITLALPYMGKMLYRSYSLCGDGQPDWPWEITVKRVGIASDMLSSRVMPGATLYASPPRGAFTLPRRLDPNTPLIFIAAGSGITPIYGMLQALARQPRELRPPVQLHYASHAPANIIFGHELAEIDPSGEWLKQQHYLTTRGQRLTPAVVLAHADILTPDAHWYICTPETLKQDMLALLDWRGVDAARIHTEVFASPKARVLALSCPLHSNYASADDSARRTAAVLRIRLAESDTLLDVRPQETLLETLERHGCQPRYGCRAGVCGDCRLRVLAGRVAAEDDGVLTAAERAAGYVLSCTAQPLGDVTLALGSNVRANVRARQATTSRAARIVMQAHSVHGRAKATLRLGVLAATCLLFAGAWLLTGQSPSSSPRVSMPASPQVYESSAAPYIPPHSTPPHSTPPHSTPPHSTATLYDGRISVGKVRR